MKPERALELLDAINAEVTSAEAQMRSQPTPQMRAALDILMHSQTRAREHYVTIVNAAGDESWEQMLRSVDVDPTESGDARD